MVIAVNLLLLLVFTFTARTGLPWVVVLTLVALLGVAVLWSLLAFRRGRLRLSTLVSIVGTAALWSAIFLTQREYQGPYPDFVALLADLFIYGGAAVLLAAPTIDWFKERGTIRS